MVLVVRMELAAQMELQVQAEQMVLQVQAELTELAVLTVHQERMELQE